MASKEKSTPPVLRLRVGKRPSELIRVRDRVEAFLQTHALPADRKLDVLVSIEEALSNILRHGRSDSAESRILVIASVAGGEIEIQIEDNGSAFDPLAYQPPPLDVPLADRREGGLGIHLVRTLMDRVHYERKRERNCLRMTKKFGEPTAHRD